MIRMIALDFDGTLLDDQKIISAKDAEAIQKAREKGVRIVACSGRYEKCMLYGLHTLDLFHEGEYFIASNGARIVEGGSDRELHSTYMPKESMRQILQAGKQFAENGNPQVYANNHHYVERFVESTARYDHNAGRDSVKVDSLDSCLDMNVEKIVFAMVNEEKNMEILQEGMRPFVPEGIQMFRSASYLLEFVSKEAGKWGAIEYLCRYFGFSTDEVLTMGDGENDFQMISRAGYSGVPANADPLLLRSARYVSPLDNNHAAVADIIEHFWDEMGQNGKD